jgi:ABC-2 type transport system permease protein
VTRTGISAVARLDLSEVLRSRWLVFALLVQAALAAIFVLVGLRESTVIAFTGTGRVLLSFCHALVLVLPLLALSATGQVVNQARASGALELLLSQPIRRSDYFVAVSLVRFGSLALPLVLTLGSVAVIATLAWDQPIPWAFLGRATLTSSALLFAFVGLGLLISTAVQNPAKAVMLVLTCWIMSVALLDFALIGLLLQWQLPARSVFVIAGLNPVEAARLALLSGADPELSVLGPVGFYLANRVGSGALFVLGVAWPVVLGAASWGLAAWSFRRGDVV